MRRVIVPAITISAFVILTFILGCSEDVFIGTLKKNQPPTIRITNGPIEGDSVVYRVHFYWIGNDPDGRVNYYEYVFAEGDPIGFDPADTTGLDKWFKTTSKDSIFKLMTEEYDSTITISNNPYARFSKVYTFFIRAVDDRGARSLPAYRSFTAQNLAPHAFIIHPKNPIPGHSQFLGMRVKFIWEGKDPIDVPWNYQDVDSIRHMCIRFSGFSIDELNKYPERYESYWSPWIWYDSPDDSGRSTIVGDDEILELNRSYILAVQAKDEAGAISSIFDKRTNVRHFMPMKPTGPLLVVRDPILGKFSFIGTNLGADVIYLPGGFPLNFSWKGDAGNYGGVVSSYRYGWDVEDLNDPTDWDVLPSPYHKAAPEKRFYSGIHTLYIEAVDDFGITTLAQIEINIIPVTMERNLLWVDDFYSGNFGQILWAMPTERQHDNFWIDICSRAAGFEPDRDIFDTGMNSGGPNIDNPNPPSIKLMWKYKNVIWTYNSVPAYAAWDNVIEFVPEENFTATNYISTYLSFGGHLWTCGKSDKSGGLAGVLPKIQLLLPTPQVEFPLYLKCEIWGPTVGCTDTSGVNCMVYQDYCVSVLDKPMAIFRPMHWPPRRIDWDALAWGYKDDLDPITASHPELPEEFHLWEEVTKPGRFFDPLEQGFTYVEVYNPEYWMERINIHDQSCFHPMYRMVSRNSKSALNNTVIAFWSTKYAHVVSEGPGAVAAPSVHFGVPLWFFDHEEVKAITDVIFDEWQIRGDQ